MFNFSGSATSTADFGNTSNIKIEEVNIAPNGFSFHFEGDLGVEDLGRPPYNLNFYLTEEQDNLYGSVQTSSSVHADTPTLSFWVEMKKMD